MAGVPESRPLWTYHETNSVLFKWAGILCAFLACVAITWYVASVEINPRLKSMISIVQLVVLVFASSRRGLGVAKR